jgi:hypothetical protein
MPTKLTREELSQIPGNPYRTGNVPSNADYQDFTESFFNFLNDTAAQLGVDETTRALWETKYNNIQTHEDTGKALLLSLLNLLFQSFHVEGAGVLPYQRDGEVSRSTQNKLNDWVSVLDFHTGPGYNVTAAVEAAFQYIIDRGCGGTLYFPAGYDYEIGDLKELSLNSNTNGGYSTWLTCSITILAWGCDITHVGAASMWRFVGNPGAKTRVQFLGGRFFGNPDTEAMFKTRDAARFGFQIEGISNCDGPADHKGHGFLCQNWFAWSENMTITGDPVRFTNCRIDMRFMSGGVSAEFEGLAPGEQGVDGHRGTASFARLRVFNVFRESGIANNHCIQIKGGVYDGYIYNFGGNTNNAKCNSLVLIENQSATGDTIIAGFHFEGATDGGGPEAYVVDTSANSPVPKLWDLVWSGGKASPQLGAGGNTQWMRHYHNIYTSEDIECEGSIKSLLIKGLNSGEEDVDDSGGAGDVLCEVGVASVVLSAVWIKGNYTYLVHIKESGNDIVGYTFIARRQGQITFTRTDIGVPVGGSFGQTAGSLTFTNSLGSDKTVRVTCLRLR